MRRCSTSTRPQTACHNRIKSFEKEFGSIIIDSGFFFCKKNFQCVRPFPVFKHLIYENETKAGGKDTYEERTTRTTDHRI